MFRPVKRRVAGSFRSGLLAGALCIAGLLVLGCGQGADSGGPGIVQARSDGPLRVVSLNPSLTAILLALDAADVLVGVDDFSAAQQPEVAHLPRVGGLFNPSLEGVAALQPDLVVLVPSVEQRDFRERLGALGVEVVAFENILFDEVLHNISELGRLVGRPELAAARVAAIRASRVAAERLARERPRQRTVLVLQRDPVFIAGRGNFLDELLVAAGAENLGAEFPDAYPQVAVEWLVEAAPELLIDMTDEPGDPYRFWSRWPAIPAVAAHRVLHLDPKTVTLPGPYLDRSIAALVSALHGPGAGASLLVATRPDADAP
jgi:iron complex transport system substrate-binding protein